MEDKLQENVKYYKDNLAGRKFNLIATGKKGKVLELNIYFGIEHFKHLAGLHKLKDLQLSRQEPLTLWQEIIEEKITMKQVNASSFASEVEQRFKNFDKIKEVLTGSNTMLKSLHGEFFTIKADYLLYAPGETDKYLHLLLKEDTEIVVPVSFFSRNDEMYLYNNERLTVKSIVEIKKENKEQSSASSEVAVTQEPTTSTVKVKPNGADVIKKKDFVEIEPRQIYGEQDGKYILKSDADSQGNKKKFLVSKQSVKVGKDGKVIAISEKVQASCKFPSKQGNLKTRTRK